MLSWAPLLAQLVTVSVADRTEARLIVADDPVYGKSHYEAATYPTASVSLGEKRLRLWISYTPSITVVPLESQPRQTLVLHSASLSGSYGWRRTSLTVGSSVSYGDQNYRLLATSGAVAPAPTTVNTPNQPAGGQGSATPGGNPAPPGGASGTQPPVTGQVTPNRALTGSFQYFSYSATASVLHRVSAALAWSTSAGYSYAESKDSNAQAVIPTVRSPNVSFSVRQRFDGANDVSGTLLLQRASSSNGNLTYLSTLTGVWNHRFDVRTSAQLSVGLNGGRNSRDDGYVAYSIYPTFFSGITNVTRLSPGTLVLSAGAGSAPAMDFDTLILDPQLSFNGSAGYSRDRFFSTLSVGTTYSISKRTDGAFSGASGSWGVGYRLGAAVAVDGGVRVAYQTYQGLTALPFTVAAYVGLSVALSDRL